MEKTAVFKMVLEYFKENEDEFTDAIEDLDNYCGYLGDDRYYDMSELFDYYCPKLCANTIAGMKEAREAFDNLLNRIYFGHDADTWHTDAHGEKEYGSFNPLRDYFTYNGYGNLISTDYKDYSDRLDEYFVESLYYHKDLISFPPEVEDLFELIEEQ